MLMIVDSLDYIVVNTSVILNISAMIYSTKDNNEISFTFSYIREGLEDCKAIISLKDNKYIIRIVAPKQHEIVLTKDLLYSFILSAFLRRFIYVKTSESKPLSNILEECTAKLSTKSPIVKDNDNPHESSEIDDFDNAYFITPPERKKNK